MTTTSQQAATQPNTNVTTNVTPTTTPVTGGKLGVPQRPQVNLLPVEVTHRRQKASAQRRLIWTIIATFIVIALGFGGATLVQANAVLDNAAAMATSDDLLQQRKEYSPVIDVKDSIEATQLARSYVLATEVNWSSYVYALAAVLPEGVEVVSLQAASAGAGEGLVEGADALTTNAIGVITFEATSVTLPEASEWIDAVEALPGLADMNLQSVELNESEDATYYDVTATVQVTVDAAANRVFSDQPLEDLVDAASAEEAPADAESGE